MSTEKKPEQDEMLNQNQANDLTIDDLCRIKDFQVGDLPKNSMYIRPFRATFVDEGSSNPAKRMWDAINAHVSL